MSSWEGQIIWNGGSVALHVSTGVFMSIWANPHFGHMLAWSLTHRTEQTVSATMGTAGAFYSVPLNYQFHRQPLHFGYLRQPSFLLPVTWPLTTFSGQQVSSTYLVVFSSMSDWECWLCVSNHRLYSCSFHWIPLHVYLRNYLDLTEELVGGIRWM